VEVLQMNDFEKMATVSGSDGLYADGINTIQVNVGLKCNQACSHCHLSASPDSREIMDWPVMEKVLAVAKAVCPETVDITGGAPELNPHLRRFIEELSRMGISAQVRTNLTALLEKGSEDLTGFFRTHKVKLVGSLPCYLEENVRAQRGNGVYEKSVEALKKLNSIGYGIDPDHQLDLVYNPGAAFLPGDQAGLEEAYKKELGERFGISFSHLLTITNMPLGRFGKKLEEDDRLGKYVKLLTESFNPDTVPGLM
jgi:radical SAM/Cys-rich protein